MKNQSKVGSILRMSRLGQGVDLVSASRDLKIHPRFLTALEEGDYAVFSSEVHLKGFLKNYAGYLGLNVDEILAFLRREYSQKGNLQVTGRPILPGDGVMAVTPERVILAATLVLVASFFVYLFYQYRSFAEAPSLSVEQPVDNSRTLSPMVNISGKTDREGMLKINGQEITLREGGNFSLTITLREGVNVLNFVARNRLGKESRISRTVIFDKPTPPVSEEAVPPGTVSTGVNLTLKIGPNAVWLEIKGSQTDESLFQGLMLPGVEETFSDPLFLRIRSGNAGSTGVTFNGQTQGQLGAEGVVVEKEFRR